MADNEESLVSNRSLIVARLQPGAASDVARLFAESDTGDLPRALGVTRRHLFTYHDLYFHYVEFAGDARHSLAKTRDRTDFRRLSDELDAYVKPFDPSTWRSPQDAMAAEFYTWTPDNEKRPL
jgi:hypothetical protein